MCLQGCKVFPESPPNPENQWRVGGTPHYNTPPMEYQEMMQPPETSIHMGVSQNEAAGTGSLSQGSVSRVCFVVCFAGLFRGSVSHSSSTSHS